MKVSISAIKTFLTLFNIMRYSSLIRTPKPYSLLHATKKSHQQHNSAVMRFKGECSYIEAEVYGVEVLVVLKTRY